MKAHVSFPMSRRAVELRDKVLAEMFKQFDEYYNGP